MDTRQLSPRSSSRVAFSPVALKTLLAAALVLGAGACAVGRAAAGESQRIVEVLRLEPGMQVADVGAGDGEWSEALAHAVGPGGSVWATEVDSDDLDDIRDRMEDAELDNVTVVLGTETDTGLPENCCDAILLRLVYHHFKDPAAMRASLRRSLRPGALLAVVDILPQTQWGRLEGVPVRDGHGISLEDLLAEMTGAGFEVVDESPDWPGDEDHFCVVFRKVS